MTPYSDSASSFDMVDDVAGIDTPIPSPDRARASQHHDEPRRERERGEEDHGDEEDASSRTGVVARSPVRTVMYPAMGALTANTSGRATDRNPTCETL